MPVKNDLLDMEGSKYYLKIVNALAALSAGDAERKVRQL